MASGETIRVDLKVVTDISDVTSNVKQIQNALNRIKVPPELRAKFNDIFSNIERQAEKASQAMANGFKNKSDVTNFEKAMNSINSSWSSLAKNLDKIGAEGFGFGSYTEQIKEFDKQIKQLEANLEALRKVDLSSFSHFSAILKDISNAPSKAKSWQNFVEGFNAGDIERMEQAWNKLHNQLGRVNDKTGEYEATVNELKGIIDIFNGATEEAVETQKRLNEARANKSTAEEAGLKEAIGLYRDMKVQIDNATESEKRWGEETRKAGEEQHKLTSELDQLKSRITYFFGAANAVNLFKRALRSTLETVKDLDKVMTETAVVTDYTVKEMWEQLPEYTRRANELGVSIHDAYEAATLYYQQGLKTNEVMQVSNETLKMARIAGLDAAEATDRMTNALRGFNMTIDENSAKNINDVYSNLAANTASNTDEISTAMTKVASLAHNANMSFENTAAFLSQIIETTRESAETAGTALKTVIARFSEVKELFSEGQLLGTDEEGEEIDVNRVSEALRTAGINLNEYLTGMKGLDEIFMELSQKWDSLDQVQQRYIATMAAGSRQQSRFIALMQDYNRMTELTTLANNSAGASQKQFEKTLESLQSKLEKLKNAWKTFLMGIADNGAIKFAIDALTGILNTVNKLLEKLPGVAKSIVSIGIAFATLKIGGKALDKILASLGSAFRGAGLKSSQGFYTGFISGIKKFFNKDFWKGTGVTTLPKIDTKNYVKSLEEMQKRQTSLAHAKRTAGNEDIRLRTNAAALEQEQLRAATATKAWNDELLVLQSELGLTATETSNLAAMTLAGVSADEAAILAKQGYTAEQLTELGASLALGAATDEENMKRGAAIVMIIAEGKAEGATTKQKIRGATASLAAKIATNAETGSIRQKIAAKIAEKLAIDRVNDSIKTSLILAGAAIGIILAVVAAIFLVVKAIKAIKTAQDNTIEKRLERAAEATTKAKEAAEEAAQAYDELSESFDNLTSKRENLEYMTEGTTEWKDAVKELNKETQELIDKYSGLKWHYDKNGILVIENEEEYKEEARVNASNAKIYAKERERDEISLEQEKILSQYRGINSNVNNIYGALESVGAAESFAKMVASGDYGTEYEEIFKELGITDNVDKASLVYGRLAGASMQDGIYADNYAFSEEDMKKISSYGESLLDAGEGVKAKNDALDKQVSLAVLENMDIESTAKAATEKYLDLNSNVMRQRAQEAADAVSLEDETVFANAAKWAGGFVENGKAYIKDENGTKVELTEDQLRDAVFSNELRKEYEATANKYQNIATKDNAMSSGGLSAKDFAEIGVDIANILKERNEFNGGGGGQANLQFGSGTNLKLDTKGRNLLDQTAQPTSSQFSGSTLASLKNSQDEDVRKKIEEYVKETYGEEADIDALVEEYMQQYNDDLLYAQAALDKGFKEDFVDRAGVNILAQIGRTTKEFTEEESKAYVEALQNVADETNDDFLISELVGGFTEDKGFTNALTLLDKMDKANVSIETAAQFWEVATKANGLYIDSVEKATEVQTYFNNKFKELTDIEGRLEEGKATIEDITKLQELGIDTSEFQYTQDGWKATEEQIESATRALKEFRIQELEAVIAATTVDPEVQAKAQKWGVNGVNNSGVMQRDENGQVSIKEGASFGDVSWSDKAALKTFGDWNGTEEDFARALQQLIDILNDTARNAKAELDMEKASIYTADELSMQNESDNAVNLATQREATEAGLNVEDVLAYSQVLQDSFDLEKQIADRIALDNARLNAGVEELTENYDDWSAAIALGPGNPKYAAALEGMKTSVNKILGVTDDLSDEFYKNSKNMDLMKRAAEGDIAAIDKLRAEAAKDIIVNSSIDTSKIPGGIDALNELIDQASTEDLEVGATLDDSQFMSGLLNALLAADATVEDIEAAFNSIGWEPKITYKEMPLGEVGTFAGSQDQEILVPTGRDEFGMPTGYKKMTVRAAQEMGVSEDATVRVPIIGEGDNAKATSFANAFSATFRGGAKKSAPAPKTSSGGGGGGGGGSGDKPSYWENPFDELFNLQEKINESLRTREKLERDYQKLLKTTGASVKQIREDYYAQIKAMREEIKLQEKMQAGRLGQIKKLGSEIYTDDEGNRSTFSSLGVTKYANYDEKTGLLQIDWEGLEAIANDASREEEGKAAEAYINKLQELVDQYEEVRDAIWDIEDAIDDMQQQAIDSYLSFEERVMEAVVKSYEQQIEALQEMSDAIDEANDRIFEELEKQIQEERQARENEKTEQNIEDKETRLAYLQRDTSGANDLEILQLQKEIDEARESYQDSLIDQAINQLKEDADLAAQQRARQIEIMTAQLQLAQNNGELWPEVYDLINGALEPGEDGGLSLNSDLINLLKQQEEFTALSNFGKDEWIKKVAKEFNDAQQGLAAGGADKAGDHENQKKVDAATEPAEPVKKSGGTPQPTQPTQPTQPAITVGGRIDATGAKIYDMINGKASTQYFSKDPKYVVLEEKSGWLKVRHHSAKSGVSGWFRKADVKAYKTGGLADFTGPAWLDGSKAKPEAVLNATDTKNLITLKNILAQLLSAQSAGGFGVNGGDNYYDIDISADIGSDYDVDKLASRIKKQIQDDSLYRNVNAISYLR